MPHTYYSQVRNPLPDPKPEPLASDGEVWKTPWDVRQFYSGETISFSTKRNTWGSRYSFTPTCYMTVKDELLSSNLVATPRFDSWWWSDLYNTAQFVEYGFACDDGKSGLNTLSRGYVLQPLDCKAGYVGHMYDMFAEGKQPYYSENFGDVLMYEFKGKKRIWKHDVNPIYGKFYQDDDTTYNVTTRGYDSFVEVVANDNPSSIKDYHSISLESPNSNFKAEVSTNTRRGGFIDAAYGDGGQDQYYPGDLEPKKKLPTDQYGVIGGFQDKEGYQYSPMPRDQKNITPSRLKLIGRLRTKPNRNPNSAGEIPSGHPLATTEQAYNLNPYTPDGVWTGPMQSYLQGGSNLTDDMVGEREGDWWDVKLFGPLISSFGTSGVGRQVFFGKTLLSTTGTGIVHSAYRYSNLELVQAGGHSNTWSLDPPPENYGYAGGDGNQENLKYQGGGYNPKSQYYDSLNVYDIENPQDLFLPSSAAPQPLEIMSYNLTEIPETATSRGRPANSIRLRLKSNFLGAQSMGDTSAFPRELAEYPHERDAKIAGLKYIQERAIPDFKTIVPDMNYDLDETYNYSELELNRAGWIGVYVLESGDGEVLKGPSATIKVSVPGGFEPVSLSAINVEYKNTKLDGSLG